MNTEVPAIFKSWQMIHLGPPEWTAFLGVPWARDLPSQDFSGGWKRKNSNEVDYVQCCYTWDSQKELLLTSYWESNSTLPVLNALSAVCRQPQIESESWHKRQSLFCVSSNVSLSAKLKLHQTSRMNPNIAHHLIQHLSLLPSVVFGLR